MQMRPLAASRSTQVPARSGQRRAAEGRAKLLPAMLAMLAVPASVTAQVAVGESLGALVSFAILEAPDGRRAIAGAGGIRMRSRVATTLVTEDGRGFSGGEETVPAFVQPARVVSVPGRAVERVKSEWILRRPPYVDIVSAPFLEAHCLWIENGDSNETVVIRFEPAREVQGPNLSGAFVVERTTGRVRSDTLVLESPPKGAPGAGRFVFTYGDSANAGDPIPLPQRWSESLRPDDLWVRLERQRVRIVETIRVVERIQPEAGSADP